MRLPYASTESNRGYAFSLPARYLSAEPFKECEGWRRPPESRCRQEESQEPPASLSGVYHWWGDTTPPAAHRSPRVTEREGNTARGPRSPSPVARRKSGSAR